MMPLILCAVGLEVGRDELADVARRDPLAALLEVGVDRVLEVGGGVVAIVALVGERLQDDGLELLRAPRA